MNFYCVALKESSHFWLVFYQTSKEQNEKLNLMTNCLDNFILCKNLCRDIEPSNLIVTVFLRKILTACSCLKQN